MLLVQYRYDVTPGFDLATTYLLFYTFEMSGTLCVCSYNINIACIVGGATKLLGTKSADV